MICPSCRSASCRRSKRRGVADYSRSALGLRPWRCRKCEARFYAWVVAIPYVVYVHCPRCGNFDLQRIAQEHVVEGWFRGLKRVLRVPAYRCDPCRHRFFSLRPVGRFLVAPAESVASQTPGQS